MDKTGIESVKEELRSKGIPDFAIGKLEPVLNLKGDTASKLKKLESIVAGNETAMNGVKELRTLFDLLEPARLVSELEFDLTLARGLNYYTGAIIEVKAKDMAIGSIAGGGRYDNLTGVFGMEGVSGVGISFGADRIYDVMMHLNLFGEISSSATRVLILNFGEEETAYALRLSDLLKNRNISSEIYPDPVKIRKQMSYADSNRIPFVVLAGEEEIRNNEVTVKVMETGEQIRMTLNELDLFAANNLKMTN